MGQVNKSKNHNQTSYHFDCAGVLSFGTLTILASQAITTSQAVIAFPCSCKILGMSVYNSTGAANNPTALGLRYDSTTFLAIPASSTTQINGHSDIAGLPDYPPANGTFVIGQGTGVSAGLSVTYQPIMIAGNDAFSNITTGLGIVTTAANTGQLFAALFNGEMIYQKGHSLLLSYVTGATVAGTLVVSLFYKPVDLRADRPNVASGDTNFTYATVQ